MDRRSFVATTAGFLTASSAGCLRLSGEEAAIAPPSEAGTDSETTPDEETSGTSSGAPMFQYDAANTGTNPDETGPQSSVGEQWSYETFGAVEASPTVVDGTVYVGSDDSVVYALSAADGTKQWEYDTGLYVKSSAAVVDDTVYVGTDEGTVFALSAADGTTQWSYETDGNLSAPPVVVDGYIYVTTEDGVVYA